MGNFSLVFILCVGVAFSVAVGSYAASDGSSHRLVCSSAVCGQ